MAEVTTGKAPLGTVPKGVMHSGGVAPRLVQKPYEQKRKLHRELEALGILGGSEPFGW